MNVYAHFTLRPKSAAEDRAMRELLAKNGIVVPEGSNKVETRALENCKTLDYQRLEQEASAGGSFDSLNLDALQHAFAKSGTAGADRARVEARYRAELTSENLAATALSISGDLGKMSRTLYGGKVPTDADLGKMESRLRSLAKTLSSDDWFLPGLSAHMQRVHTAVAEVLLASSTFGNAARNLVAKQWENAGGEELARLAKGVDRVSLAMAELVEKADLFRTRPAKDWEPKSLGELVADAKKTSPDGDGIGRWERVELDTYKTKGFVWVPWKEANDTTSSSSPDHLAHFLQGHDIPKERRVSAEDLQQKLVPANKAFGANVVVSVDAVVGEPNEALIANVKSRRSSGTIAPREELIATLRDQLVHSQLFTGSARHTNAYGYARDIAGELFETMLKTILSERRNTNELTPKLQALVDQLTGNETEHTPSIWAFKRFFAAIGVAYKESAFSTKDHEMIGAVHRRFETAIKDIEKKFEHACAPLSNADLLEALGSGGRSGKDEFTASTAGQKLGKAVDELVKYVENEWAQGLRADVKQQLRDRGYHPNLPAHF